MIKQVFVETDSTCTLQWFDFGYDGTEKQVDKPSSQAYPRKVVVRPSPPRHTLFTVRWTAFVDFSTHGFFLFEGTDIIQINFFKYPDSSGSQCYSRNNSLRKTGI